MVEPRASGSNGTIDFLVGWVTGLIERRDDTAVAVPIAVAKSEAELARRSGSSVARSAG